MKPATPPRRVNQYGGLCAECAQYVEAEAGWLLRRAGRWMVKHKANQCPPWTAGLSA